MWIGLAFISAFLLGCYEVNKKISLDGNAVIPVLFFNTLIGSLIFVPFSDRLVVVDIRLLCPETFAADHYRTY